MAESSLIGIYEIAELADVSASAVANWRKRFSDFPAPLAELKSGPVFGESQIKRWLARRHANDLPEIELFYDQLASKRGDPPELRAKVEEVIDKIEHEATSTKRPGILLGRVQSGKTRAYLGIIARAFDKGYDVAVILTKGTKSLAEQTISRVKEDFNEFIESDKVEVFDILAVPELTPYELMHKLIFVAKKEDDNLRRLLDLFQTQYPELQQRGVLIIDDEADLASVSGRRVNGVNIAGIISRQIDQFRELARNSAFLQVTATPYSLYLQPEDEVHLHGSLLFKPKRPAFTALLPTHESYVGGDEYFDKSTDPDSLGLYFFREVPIQERDALKKEDRRRLQIDKVLTERNVAVLRDAIVTFLVGGAFRRLQQRSVGVRAQKYSFLFHTEQARSSHEWQVRVASAIRDALVDQARVDSPLFNELLRTAYSDLRRSIALDNLKLPVFEDVKTAVIDSLLTGQLMITKVNSDNEIKNLLASDGQLKLRTPFNMFIGGQILDRGITINNLIAFYYGRNPNRFQQDTVLQHSRMYGARSSADLTITRFFAPLHVYQIMKRIHEFDGALREAFESGAHDRGVYFMQRDAARRLIPCSPNKLLFSDVVSIRPGRRLVLSGFQTVSKSAGSKNLSSLDSKIKSLVGSSNTPKLVDVEEAVNLLDLAFANLEFPDESTDDDRQAHLVALEHLSRMCRKATLKGKVWLMAAADRDVARYREEGRFSNAPDTKQQKDLAQTKADDVPVLMMLRQSGDEAKGWRGLPFWWPVILTSRSSATVIFATKEAISPTLPAGEKDPRLLSSEEI
jgi:Z1 domain-containing protein/type III restriction/modification enzyme restriction subunit